MLRILHNDNRGFTLIELLIVIAILGILAAIAIPLLLGQKSKAVITEAETNLQILRTVNEQFYAENARYAPETVGAPGLEYIGPSGGLADELRGFQPGSVDDLNFTYTLISNNSGQGFIAEATGKAGSSADGIFRSLDNNGIWKAE